MDEQLEKPNPYIGHNMMQPERFEFENQGQYKLRRKMLSMALKRHRKGTLCFISSNKNTEKGQGISYVKKDVEDYIRGVKEKEELNKLNEEDHIN